MKKKILAVSALLLLAAGFAAAWPGMMGLANGWNETGWNATQVQAMQRMMQGQLQQSDVAVLNDVMGRRTSGAVDWDDMPCHQAGAGGVSGRVNRQGMAAMHNAMHGG